ncbi:MAG: hypothetical protein ACHBNF_19685 [Chromatiales bacterium]
MTERFRTDLRRGHLLIGTIEREPAAANQCPQPEQGGNGMGEEIGGQDL